MIRPSALTLAMSCPASAYLAAEHNIGNANTERGNEVDGQITAYIREGDEPSHPDALACVNWLRTTFPPEGYEYRAQEKLQLWQGDELVTEGTPDCVVISRHWGGRVIILDWKSAPQWWSGRLAHPNRNLQTHSYGIAAVVEFGAAVYQPILVTFHDGEVEPIMGDPVNADGWQPVLARIVAVQKAERRYIVGPHCKACYSSDRCPAWLAPSSQLETELAPLAQPGGLTAENAPAALLAYERMRELTEKVGDILENYVTQHGPIVVGDKQWGPVPTKGRGGVDVEALKAAGLYEKFYRPGRMGVSKRWTKVKGAAT